MRIDVTTEGQRALSVPRVEPANRGGDVKAVIRAVATLAGTGVDSVDTIAELRPVQAECLAELRRAGGLVGFVGVGRGKELVCLFAASVVTAERPVLMCPPGLVSVCLEEAAKFGQAFRIRGDLRILPYSMLSQPHLGDVLERLRPDLLIANEAHCLRNRSSARTKRVLRYLDAHPECRFAALSGTLTNGSLRDYAHILEAALRAGSPVPREGADLSSWAEVVDADGDPLPRDLDAVRPLVEQFGESLLERFISATDNPQLGQWALAERCVRLTEIVPITPPRLLREARELGWSETIEAGQLIADLMMNDGWWQHAHPPYCGVGMSAVNQYEPTRRWRDLESQPLRDRARAALRRRLASAPGVVMTEASSCDCSLVIRRVLAPEPPAELLELIADVARNGATPDGERMFDTPDGEATCKRQLACGFCYTWDWQGTDERTRAEWLDARRAWSSGLRWALDQDWPGLDSPKLVEDAVRVEVRAQAQRKMRRDLAWLVDRYLRWKDIEPEADPQSVATWYDRYLVEDAAAWLLDQKEPAILWYRDRAFGAELAKLGIDVRGEGDPPPSEPGPVALSIAAFSQGHNLQYIWRLGRVVGSPSSGERWEQLLGRTHRDGQSADVVVCDVYQHHDGERRAFRRALERARVVEKTTGQRQKLLLARVVDAVGSVDNY